MIFFFFKVIKQKKDNAKIRKYFSVPTGILYLLYELVVG